MKAWNTIAADEPPAAATLSPPAPFDVRLPDAITGPLVFAAPHAGRYYPADLDAAADLLSLRRLEDGLVDQLVADAPDLGAPLLCARYVRAYIDVNRDPCELDADMFSDALPPHAGRRTPRVCAGLGLIARVAGEGRDIYARKLTYAEAARRLDLIHRPYHQALRSLLDDTHHRCGRAVLIDWHSMPSAAAATAADRGRRGADFILGDRYGAACHPALPQFIETALRDMGYAATRNTPYAGGYTTEYYGRPEQGRHALQIEINRALYLDEKTLKPTDDFARLKRRLNSLISHLVDAVPELVP